MTDSSGIAVFPVTTFDEDGAFDERRYREHVASLVDAAAFSSVVPLGSVGEFAALTIEERKRAIDAAIEAVDGALPVVPGTAAVSTRSTVALSRYAAEAGASAVLVPPRSYFPPSEQRVRAYYQALTEQVDVPIWAYNNPATTGIDMEPDLLAEIARLDGVVAVKSGTDDMRAFREGFRAVGEDVTYSAAPPHMFEKLAHGAQGWSGPIATIAPETAVETFHAMRSGDVEAGRETFREWQPLLAYFHRYPYVATMKAILNEQGRAVGPPRAPIQPLEGTALAGLRSEMERLDLV